LTKDTGITGLTIIGKVAPVSVDSFSRLPTDATATFVESRGFTAICGSLEPALVSTSSAARLKSLPCEIISF